MFDQMQWDADRVVCVDESATNERSTDRKMGFSPVGVPIHLKRWLKRSQKWSVLPAMSTEGWFHAIIKQGSITGDDFEHWLEHDILPKMARFDGDRDILIMDNYAIHRRPRVQQLCDRHGVRLVYLPPYSPRFNPIEGSFYDLKAYLRKHYKVMELGYDKFEDFLQHAIKTKMAGTPQAAERARGHFRHAGYQ